MRLVVALAVLLLGTGARSAWAGDKARAVLTYERIDAARDACPDEATMRGLVAARLGYDPFVESDGVPLRIEIRPDGREFVSRVTRTSNDGDKHGERTLRSSGGDCTELASSASLAVALAIDPDAASRAPEPAPPPAAPPPAAPPSPAPAPTTPLPPAPETQPKATTPVAPKPRPTPRVKLGLRVDAGLVLGAGMVPGVAFGPRLGVGLDGGLWSVSGEGTAIVPRSEKTKYGTVTASIVYGSVVPCLHPSFAGIFNADLCAAASVGALSSDATNVTRSFPTTNVYASVGPRAGITVAPRPTVGFRLSGDLGVSLARVHLNIDDVGRQREVWVSPPVSFLGSLDVVFRFR
jgi:hypothetical protein